jgi:hypothetical protein
MEKLSLIVDVPRANGSGTSNSGKAARIAFHDTKLLAEILEIDQVLIERLKNLLIAVSSKMPIDVLKFNEFCNETANIYITNYSKYPMTVTLHKLLMHGGQIISHSIVPLGMLSEEVTENANKNYKFNRMHHARLDSREHNILDVFNRSMDCSDPLISSISLEKRIKRKTKELPQEVKNLLIFTKVEGTEGEENVEDVECERDLGDEEDEFHEFSDHFELDCEDNTETF